MLFFLEIISWKRASLFNRLGEGGGGGILKGIIRKFQSS